MRESTRTWKKHANMEIAVAAVPLAFEDGIPGPVPRLSASFLAACTFRARKNETSILGCEVRVANVAQLKHVDAPGISRRQASLS